MIIKGINNRPLTRGWYLKNANNRKQAGWLLYDLYQWQTLKNQAMNH